jgi:hypothetical protein
MNNNLHKDPLPGIRIKAPITLPSSSDILLGYKIYTVDNDGIFSKPDPIKMTNRGWIAVAVAFFCFFPATCVPCFLGCSYDETYQRPIYGPSPIIV